MAPLTGCLSLWRSYLVREVSHKTGKLVKPGFRLREFELTDHALVEIRILVVMLALNHDHRLASVYLEVVQVPSDKESADTRGVTLVGQVVTFLRIVAETF